MKRLCAAVMALALIAGCAEEPRQAETNRAAASAEAEALARAFADASARPSDPFALDDPRTCLAMAMYHEARGEGAEAMRAVGHVVLNRRAARRFPSSVCDVVRQGGERPPCQFSWWCDGRSDIPHEERSWRRALAIADELLAGESADPTGGATHFYAGRRPYWADSFAETVEVGGHVFLREE